MPSADGVADTLASREEILDELATAFRELGLMERARDDTEKRLDELQRQVKSLEKRLRSIDLAEVRRRIGHDDD